MRTRDGSLLVLDPIRWHAPADRDERDLLAAVDGPVLDVGCGPGRLVRYLLARGVTAMGVDSSPAAVAAARATGAPVLQRSVWDRVPGEGRWATVLLFDGNIGIGGDPAGLLGRCAALLARPGSVLVEVGAPGSSSGPVEVRLEQGDIFTEWFDWATVSASGVTGVAGEAGLATRWVRAVGVAEQTRWFALLDAGL